MLSSRDGVEVTVGLHTGARADRNTNIPPYTPKQTQGQLTVELEKQFRVRMLDSL